MGGELQGLESVTAEGRRLENRLERARQLSYLAGGGVILILGVVSQFGSAPTRLSSAEHVGIGQDAGRILLSAFRGLGIPCRGPWLLGTIWDLAIGVLVISCAIAFYLCVRLYIEDPTYVTVGYDAAKSEASKVEALNATLNRVRAIQQRIRLSYTVLFTALLLLIVLWGFFGD